MRARSIWTSVALAALAVAACGDATTTPTITESPGPPWVPQAEQETTIQVVTPTGVLASAGVLVETTDGYTLEWVTDGEGKITFDLPPTSIRAMVAHKDGYTFSAVSGRRLAKAVSDYGSYGFYLERAAPPPMTHLTGEATNMAAPEASVLTVTADQPSSTMYQGEGPAFELQVPALTTINLIGLEWQPRAHPNQGIAQEFLGWTRVAHTPRVDTGSDLSRVPIIDEVTLDFAESLSTRTVEGAYYLPEEGMMGETGLAYMQVRTIESAGALFVGAATHITVNHYERPEEIDLHYWTEYFPMGEDWTPRTANTQATVKSGSWTPPSTYAPDIFAPNDIAQAIPTESLPIGLDGHRAEYTAEYVAHPPGTLMTQYLVLDQANNVSFAIERGAPVDGDTGLRLPSPPVAFVNPPPSIHDAVPWRPSADGDGFATVMVFNDGAMVGTMMALAEEQETYCPPLPSTSNEPGLFSGKLQGYLVTCTPSEDIEGWCARGAQVGPFTVVP